MFKCKTESGVYAPNYYKGFICTADKCRHSCCVDWEIYIDGETCGKYRQMGDIAATLRECEDGTCFALGEDGRCPHLNDTGLCNIILSHGEGCLSEICRNHPRFYNYIGGGRTEAGLGIVCEEACRLILEDEAPFYLSKIEEADDNGEDEPYFDALPQRDYIISTIESEVCFEEKLAALKAEFEIPELYTPEEWLARFLSLEILDGEWERDLRAMSGKLLRRSDKNREEYGKYYARLLSYFVYRYVSVAESEANLRARLAFALLSAEVIRSIFEEGEEQSLERLIDTARRYSAEIEYSEENTAELIFAFESDFMI